VTLNTTYHVRDASWRPQGQDSDVDDSDGASEENGSEKAWARTNQILTKMM
jgi:hypothetical protein